MTSPCSIARLTIRWVVVVGLFYIRDSCPSRRAQAFAVDGGNGVETHETTSGSVMRVREVEEASTASKRHERPPPARSGRQGRWRGRKWRRKVTSGLLLHAR